ncbi:hypothetical protein P171DRAFT_477269 [Karstenula rhodostoma CBS 690.94]|uniref:Uncharacterized protein n=1 Tax=Karstenula rhodostoma CBS 690.94 TaxID=1392251 RepID=A0A9P4P8C7_9PLEO|nr:hypothetical protein P171DRAFT_477269 [Karstenula rhodostoma CBS 690.94]
MSEKNIDAIDLLLFAAKVRTSLNANDKPIPPIPVKPVPATPLCQAKPPESGTLASLHPHPTEDDLATAAQRLRTHRGFLIEHISGDKTFRRRNGHLWDKWYWRLAAMDADDEYFLTKPSVELRGNTDYQSMEVMQHKQEQNKCPWGGSSLKHQVQRSADPRAYGDAKQRRRVGGQHTKGMVEGDIEQAALMDAEGEVEKELEGSLSSVC